MTSRGFLLGKFLPPHQGHVFLCDFARHHCDALTILVCTLDREDIPGRLRFEWMRELFPGSRVVHLADDVPQEPSEHPNFWAIWKTIVKQAHPEPIDFVYASEDYGHRLAAEVGAEFVAVDPHREAVPISGTAVRSDPIANWNFLPAPVRPYFTKTVCVFGPESTGKTTLSRHLATLFDTVHVPEYGRTYTDAFGTECPPEAFLKIAKGHRAATFAALRNARGLLIMDTDPVMTAVWSICCRDTEIPGSQASAIMPIFICFWMSMCPGRTMAPDTFQTRKFDRISLYEVGMSLKSEIFPMS